VASRTSTRSAARSATGEFWNLGALSGAALMSRPLAVAANAATGRAQINCH